MTFDDFDTSVGPEEYYLEEDEQDWEDDEPFNVDDDTDYDPYAGQYDLDDGRYDDQDEWGF